MYTVCDKCSKRYYGVFLKQCDECGDCFCDKCCKHPEIVLCCAKHGNILQFCQLKCKQEYEHLYWKCAILKALSFATTEGEQDNVGVL